MKSLTKTLAQLSLVGALALTGCGRQEWKKPNKTDYLENTHKLATVIEDVDSRKWLIESYDSNGLPDRVLLDADYVYLTKEEMEKDNTAKKLGYDGWNYREMTPGLQKSISQIQRSVVALTYERDKEAWNRLNPSNKIVEAQN